VTSDPEFKVTTIFFVVEYHKKACLKDKVTIVQQETIPNIWNGTMFVDFDWPLNASRWLSASAELLVTYYFQHTTNCCQASRQHGISWWNAWSGV